MIDLLIQDLTPILPRIFERPFERFGSSLISRRQLTARAYFLRGADIGVRSYIITFDLIRYIHVQADADRISRGGVSHHGSR